MHTSSSSDPLTHHADVLERAYRWLAPVYDLVYGAALENGRLRAMDALRLCPGEHVLEIGVGTGAMLPLYPEGVTVAAVDLSTPMLARAKERLQSGPVVADIGLLRMNAGRLAFPAHTFDVVFAAYVVNAVDDPMSVVREMKRVCCPNGRIVFLNHFQSDRRAWRTVERLATPIARRFGFRWDLPLADVLAAADLSVVASIPVNVPRLSRLVICRP
jgi:phosphatidylethanolamine/phosphatidyl-N-methylethanolamine N-methyltransferase